MDNLSSRPGDFRRSAPEGIVTAKRRGLTIVELFVVLAIISILLAFLLPAVQSVRERARETVCKNNLHQINLAIGQFAEAHKKLPQPSAPGMIGGWMVEILPFIEQQNFKNGIVIDTPIVDASDNLFRPPAVLRCPRRTVLEQTPEDAMSSGHYVFVSFGRRESFDIFDAPTTFRVPWIGGPEMDYDNVTRSIGPHSNGFFYAQGFQQGVRFMEGGQEVR